MNILLTNDDGIDGEGLVSFAEGLRRRAEHKVYVLAPDTNRSGVSQAISFLAGPLRLSERGERSWACSGTPADCVMLAVLGALPVKPDLVVSGINAGANIGTDILYSGTAAAARQAALYGIPAIALSLVGKPPFYWKETVDFAVERLGWLAGLWRADTFINVNIPNAPKTGGVATTFPSLRRYEDSLELFQSRDGRKYGLVNFGDIITKPEAGSDGDAVARNLVSVSPVFIHPVVRHDQCPCAPEYAGVSPRP
ncbi:MAG: 5'/3'-nucleotidase SurE [Spirochaetaceae bacterium]|jgi:5'-nucleotidase|nr:5'/3'-nucleotidase SurE [Spirochaetaceae bacterium]